MWSAEFDTGLEGLMLMGSCIVPGTSLEVAYLIWKVSCFKAMAASLEHVIGKLKFSMDVVPLRFKLAVLVVNVVIVLNHSEGVPAVLIHNSFAKGVKGGTRTYEEVVEPGGHRIGGIGGVVWAEI
jgi:hypothetical protein